MQNMPVRLHPCGLLGGLQMVPWFFSSRLWSCSDDGCTDADSKVFQPSVLWAAVAWVVGERAVHVFITYCAFNSVLGDSCCKSLSVFVLTTWCNWYLQQTLLPVLRSEPAIFLSYDTLGCSRWYVFSLWKQRWAFISFRQGRSWPSATWSFLHGALYLCLENFWQGGQVLMLLWSLMRISFSLLTWDKTFTAGMCYVRLCCLVCFLSGNFCFLHSCTWKGKCSWVSSFSHFNSS